MPVILPDDDQRMDDKDTDMDSHHNHDHNDINHQTMDHDQDSSSHESMHSTMMNQGTIMYMDGFRSALFPSSSQPLPPCLNLFSPSWTLTSSGIFVFAMVCVTLIGMLVEACGVWRVKCLRRGRGCRREAKLRRLRHWEEQQQPQPQHPDVLQEYPLETQGVGSVGSDMNNVSLEGNRVLPSLRTSPAIFRRIKRSIRTIQGIIFTKICCCFLPNTNNDDTQARSYDIAAALLHAARAALGYLLMLAVMTYAVEFLFCAVLGMVLGRCLSADMDGSENVVTVGGVNGALDVGGVRQSTGEGVGMANLNIRGNPGEWGGGDPCCGIDDDEDDDHNHDEGLVGGSVMREPLLSSLIENHVGGVTRRSGGAR